MIDKSEEEYLNVAYYPTKLNEYMDAKDFYVNEIYRINYRLYQNLMLDPKFSKGKVKKLLSVLTHKNL
mgnify:CR=1 FL=1